MKLTKAQQHYYTEYFKKQIGRKYPCSNQTVLCGVITTSMKKAEQLLTELNFIKIKNSLNRSEWEYNNERWRIFFIDQFYCMRGYRFYKVKIDKDIDAEDFQRKVLPYCSLYCCEMEFF